jgi:ribosome-associated toxin RatA of RatAB toxin-antitoxin module
MADKLTKLTREEECIKFNILQREQTDPLYRTRVKVHFGLLKQQYETSLKDLTFSPEDVFELSQLVREYGKTLAVITKMDVVSIDKDGIFQEADITAQDEEASKLKSME